MRTFVPAALQQIVPRLFRATGPPEKRRRVESRHDLLKYPAIFGVC
jgi:hypothetical protein